MKTSGNCSWPQGLHLPLHHPLSHVTMSKFWNDPSCLSLPSNRKIYQSGCLRNWKASSFLKLIFPVSPLEIEAPFVDWDARGSHFFSEYVPWVTRTQITAGGCIFGSITAPRDSESGADIWRYPYIHWRGSLPDWNCCFDQCARLFFSPHSYFLWFLGLWQYFAFNEFLFILGCQGSTMRMKTQLHEGEKRKGKGRMEECWVLRWIVFREKE